MVPVYGGQASIEEGLKTITGIASRKITG